MSKIIGRFSVMITILLIISTLSFGQEVKQLSDFPDDSYSGSDLSDIKEHMLNALLGHLAVRYYWQTGEPIKEPETIRKPDGFFPPHRNRKVSAVGLYKGRNIENPLEIYHNPCTTNPIPDLVFMRKGIRQLIKATNTEMKWI